MDAVWGAGPKNEPGKSVSQGQPRFSRWWSGLAGICASRAGLCWHPRQTWWERGSCLPSPAPNIQWWGSFPGSLHTTPPCPVQLLLSLAMGTGSHMDSPTLAAPGSKSVWSHQRFKPPSGPRGPRSSRGSVRGLELGGRAGSLHRENRTAPVWQLLRAWRGTCSLPSGHTSLVRPGEAHVHGSC